MHPTEPEEPTWAQNLNDHTREKYERYKKLPDKTTLEQAVTLSHHYHSANNYVGKRMREIQAVDVNSYPLNTMTVADVSSLEARLNGHPSHTQYVIEKLGIKDPANTRWLTLVTIYRERMGKLDEVLRQQKEEHEAQLKNVV